MSVPIASISLKYTRRFSSIARLESITAVEWGDIVEDDFSNALSITFEFMPGQDNWRKLTLSATAERWLPVLENLNKQLQA